MHCIGLRICILESTRILKEKLVRSLLFILLHLCNASCYILFSHVEFLVSKIRKKGYVITPKS